MTPDPPDQVFGDLFTAVQTTGVFPDSKTFVDTIPKYPPEEILSRYFMQKDTQGFQLGDFVLRNFELPVSRAKAFVADPARPVEDHIRLLWEILKRNADRYAPGSSLIPLPHPYVVPGGRFGEIYYWDSYFTMLGLIASGERTVVRHMVDNFAWLIDRFGFIPNGNRTYFLTRSQPPFFALMVALLAQSTLNAHVYVQYLPQLKKEYAFWMDGQERLKKPGDAFRRVVRAGDVILNRYWDDSTSPRQESYPEDIALQRESGREATALFRDIRAACESGWDFSARWFRVADQLETIRTTQIVPVDLNCLLYTHERILSKASHLAGDRDAETWYDYLAGLRRSGIIQYCRDQETNLFYDYDYVEERATGIPSMAMVFPLFTEIATRDQAQAVADLLKKAFLRAGGYLTTLAHSGQQWDAPNGWAPLQWIAYQGLKNYGFDDLAIDGARKWVDNNIRVYRNTGKLVEKYNVEDTTLEAGGGEYPVQDGFGWTNGVLLKLIKALETEA